MKYLKGEFIMSSLGKYVTVEIRNKQYTAMVYDVDEIGFVMDSRGREIDPTLEEWESIYQQVNERMACETEALAGMMEDR